MTEQATITEAWVHLTRLCGCNYRVPVQRRGQSLYVRDPQGPTTYRLSAATFDAGRPQFRDSWCIEPWTARAEQVQADESNWQD